MASERKGEAFSNSWRVTFPEASSKLLSVSPWSGLVHAIPESVSGRRLSSPHLGYLGPRVGELLWRHRGVWRRGVYQNQIESLLERRTGSGCWEGHIVCSLHKWGPFDDLTLKHKLFLAIHNFNSKCSINNDCIYEWMNFELSYSLYFPKCAKWRLVSVSGIMLLLYLEIITPVTSNLSLSQTHTHTSMHTHLLATCKTDISLLCECSKFLWPNLFPALLCSSVASSIIGDFWGWELSYSFYW